MTDRISPEEKLFNIIKDGKGSGSGGAVSKGRAAAGFFGIREFFESLKRRHGAGSVPTAAVSAGAQGNLPLSDIDPKVINKVLAVVLAVIVMIFFLYIGRKRPDVSKIEASIPKEQASKSSEIESFKPLDSYEAAVKRRNIFKALPKEEVVSVSASKDGQAKLREIAKDLKLVGISWGEDPKALIRSEKDKNTFFVKKGRLIGTTEAEVKDIARNKVVIGYQGEEMELQ